MWPKMQAGQLPPIATNWRRSSQLRPRRALVSLGFDAAFEGES
jgi:hypothetical protein